LKVYPEARPYYDLDPQGQRLVSTVLEPNIAAGMIVIVLLVYLGQLACGARLRLWKPALLLLALMMTISRSGALAFVVGVLAILAIRGMGKRFLKFTALAMAIGLAVAPWVWSFMVTHSRFGMSDSSAVARAVIWQRALVTFWENRWFGIGFNTYGFVQERMGYERIGAAAYSAEGGLLFIAVMTGIVGLLAYGIMLWYTARTCRFVWRNPAATAEQRGMSIGTAAATGAILVHSVFVNSLLTPYVMEPLWVLWGLMFIVASSLRGSRASAPPSSGGASAAARWATGIPSAPAGGAR
jgi:O-antigen ligase